MCGTVDVILARISPHEFGVYQAMAGNYDHAANERAVQSRKQARAHFGWAGKPTSDMYGSETDGDHNHEAEHRYCEVSHGAI
jgi:hypothetical protein